MEGLCVKSSMKEETLYEKLEDYSKSDYYPFHMPGHKRNPVTEQGMGKSPYLYDITEIDGFDNLHHPEGIIRKRQEEAATFYESEKSYFLVNGSTCGILSAISAATEEKNTILMARNSHKSSYNAVFLLNVKSEYLYPAYKDEYGFYAGISPKVLNQKISEMKEIEKIGAVYITSPTYEGIVCDIEGIANVAHAYHIPLIVDEAHGAHFGMHEYFPESALKKGADIVIQSLHKTLPSLTQTAILHIGKNSLISAKKVEKYLGIYQSSSPSYVLMESIDRCIDYLRKEKETVFQSYTEKLEQFRKKCSSLKYFKLFYDKGRNDIFDYDRSKLVIIPDERYFSGKKLYDRLLEKYHIQLEMASEKYAIAMTSVNDTEDGFLRLFSALEDIEREIRISLRYRQIYANDGDEIGAMTAFQELSGKSKDAAMAYVPKKAVVCRKMKDAYLEKYDMIELCMAKGKISEEFIYLYPPGIPILAPGEIITEEIIETVKRYQKAGLSVQGMEDTACRMIKVVQENWKPICF
jgi:arginine/lysine/ornithine decarboxylase